MSSVKSLLFQDVLPFGSVPGCEPCRQEQTITIRKFGRLYTFKVRDKVTVEDPLIVAIKAQAFAISQGEPYNGQPTSRALRDLLIKSNILT